MQVGQRFRDGEAEARAMIALGQLAFDLLERPPEFRQRLRRDADAAVHDGEHHRAVQHAAAHGDLSAIGRELHRIRQQVHGNLFHGAAVRDDRDRAANVGGDDQILVLSAA